MRFSIIIPAYNAEKTIENTIKSVEKLSYDKKLFELLIVNDGSTDRTEEVVNSYAPSSTVKIRLLSKPNGGVSSARNLGILNSEADLIVFLDADDSLSIDALNHLDNFFKTYEGVDIAVYNIQYSNLTRHWREGYLKKTGVYDANKFCYAAITTVNFCIRNSQKFFFNETQKLHEDEEFATHIVMKNGKFGFVKEAIYYYENKNQNSVMNTRLNPYYSFDHSVEMYERLIAKYNTEFGLPDYIQALILNDLSWKLRANVLYSNGRSFKNQKIRIVELLKKISVKVILNHPNVDKYHRQYFIKERGSHPKIYPEGLRLMWDCEGYKFQIKENQLYIHKIVEMQDEIRISGFFKNYISDYLDWSEIRLFLIYDGITRELSKRETFYSYHRCNIKTNNFIGFDVAVPKVANSFAFYVCIKGNVFKINTVTFKDFPAVERLTIFLKTKVLKLVKREGVFLSFNRTYLSSFCACLQTMTQSLPKGLLKALVLTKKNRIHLYSDKEGVLDNSFFQFLHDRSQNDEIKRFYIYNSQKDKTTLLERGCYESELVRFASLKHQFLYLSAEKIITSFIDRNFYCPIGEKNYRLNYATHFRPQVYYVQHGVLHARINRYAYEKNNIDKIVISTTLEKQYLRELGYPDDCLICSGMPRFSGKVKRYEPGLLRKILYIPSWRSYLSKKSDLNTWTVDLDKLCSSSFWLGVLNLSKLVLSENFKIDIKLHPIFSECRNLGLNGGLSIVDCASIDDYDAVITDYSSFVYDAIFSGKPVFYFCPDIVEYEEGLNLYSETVLPMKNGIGPFASTASDLISNIRSYNSNPNEFGQKFSHLYKQIFFDFENPTKTLYQELIKVM